MDAKDQKELLKKTLEKFKNMSREEARESLVKMFSFEPKQESQKIDKFIIVCQTKRTFLNPVPTKPDYKMIHDNINRLINIVGSLNKKNGYR